MIMGGVLCGCSTPDEYKIAGTIEGMPDGEVVVLKQKFTKEEWDTLARTESRDGKFLIRGKVKEPIVGFIGMKGMSGMMILIEPATEFVINMISEEIPVVTGGGREQALYREFSDIRRRMSEQFEKMSPDLEEALRGDEAKRKEYQERLDAFSNDMKREEMAYLKKNANSFFALYQLACNALGMDVESVKAAFESCSEVLKNTEPGKYVQSLLPNLAKIAIGSVVPDFTAKTPEGKDVSLYETKGKIKLLDFWASNCGICREEIRKMIPIYDQYKAEGFVILSFSLDKSREAWVEAIEQDGTPWVQVSDLKGIKSPLNQTYGIWALPANLLLDENNKVLARNINSEQLREILSKYLKSK